MSAPRPLEVDLLAEAESMLSKCCASFKPQQFEARLQILEACASRFGGFDLQEFHKIFDVGPICAASDLIEMAGIVSAEIEKTPILPPLALSALARETLVEMDRKTTGAYHTDFRLARRLAQLAAPTLTHRSKVIDPACGAGILLVALTLEVCGMDRRKIGEWFAKGVCAADLSANSLRGALLSLASLTDDTGALAKMRARWICGDSLMADKSTWEAMAPGGFDAVIGNPPWEKVKLTRHDFLKSSGAERHYGEATPDVDDERFLKQKASVTSYAKRLLARYPDLGCGEPDLYIAFSEMFSNLCRSGGVVAALVPGGLIRSQGTEAVRRRLLGASESASISIIENRARFFSIDTRFKFLAIALVKAKGEHSKRHPIKLLHESGTADGLRVVGSATIGRASLASSRQDLSIPEVRSSAEWKIFQKVSAAGVSWSDKRWGWEPQFCREIDMTRERSKFLYSPKPGTLPLVEGRMVQQHRFGVKGHVSGSGRKAVWDAFQVGTSHIAPQFWVKASDIPATSKLRAVKLRAGFCDIAGQTNERSLMAALVPPGVACGNKVPTILFKDDPSEERLLTWVAVANSIPFDWMLRRILTTTVNYFLLVSLPMPKLAKGGLPWHRLVTAARELRKIDSAGGGPDPCARMAQLRPAIDAEVAVAYGLSIDDLVLMLEDFPILDRGQPPLPGETRSTITRDTLMACAARRMNESTEPWKTRAAKALALGAQAYIPSEIAGANEELEEADERASHGR